MTPGDVARVLTKCAAYDQRTIGESDVAAWHEILASYDLGDALDAVTRHYRDSTERIMPAQLRKLAAVVRDERRRAEGCSEALALPSRYEPDPERDERIGAGLAQCKHVLKLVMDNLEAARLRSEQARQPRASEE
jgi:hypothetical protein